MKSDLTHLPQLKQDELKLICDTILASYPDIEMIILFGSYARGDYREQKDIAPDSKSGHPSDFDILAVTADKNQANNAGLWQMINSQCRKMKLSAHPKIIREDIEKLNHYLEFGYYFYSDIKKEGRILYDSEKVTLKNKRNLTPQENKELICEYYDHWFGQAKESYCVYEMVLKQGMFRKAALELFFTAEAYYKSIILVFTKNCPREHHLGLLGEMTFQFNVSLKDIFPSDSEEHQKLFDSLDYAYIGARYDPEYTITKEQLEYLAERVKKLREITEKICKEKIESFV
ncbi:MAG: HEPN domain-containing protein [Phycisphaerae bacterium]|nr:HEPN domain-containing protein [Phycisphaerae bacterium]